MRVFYSKAWVIMPYDKGHDKTPLMQLTTNKGGSYEN
jgi:hypothetical protein